MSEVYRIPSWLFAEYWEMRFRNKKFYVVVFNKNNISFEGEGFSISHAAKEAYKKRAANEKILHERKSKSN